MKGGRGGVWREGRFFIMHLRPRFSRFYFRVLLRVLQNEERGEGAANFCSCMPSLFGHGHTSLRGQTFYHHFLQGFRLGARLPPSTVLW